MSKDDLEKKCKKTSCENIRYQKAILRIADDVRDINHKLTHLLENYREDYYNALN